MVKRAHAIHFKGGRGPRFKAIAKTHSGRSVPAPRLAPSSAAAMLRALKELSQKLNKDWGPMLKEAFQDDTAWGVVVNAVRKEGTLAQAENALAVLRDHRAKHLLANNLLNLHL